MRSILCYGFCASVAVPKEDGPILPRMTIAGMVAWSVAQRALLSVMGVNCIIDVFDEGQAELRQALEFRPTNIFFFFSWGDIRPISPQRAAASCLIAAIWSESVGRFLGQAMVAEMSS